MNVVIFSVIQINYPELYVVGNNGYNQSVLYFVMNLLHC